MQPCPYNELSTSDNTSIQLARWDFESFGTFDISGDLEAIM